MLIEITLKVECRENDGFYDFNVREAVVNRNVDELGKLKQHLNDYIGVLMEV